jgi:hypothetical protein
VGRSAALKTLFGSRLYQRPNLLAEAVRINSGKAAHSFPRLSPHAFGSEAIVEGFARCSIISAVKEVVRVRRELRKARRLKDAMRLELELKRAQIEHAYARHWVNLV